MASAKTKSMKVRPIQSVDLCFDSDGIIGDQNLALAKLGMTVKAFDLKAFYASLNPPQPTAGDPNRPGQLKFNSQAILDAVKPSLLFALRAEPVKAVLDKAIAMRENSFYQKYVDQTNVINQTLATYDPTKPNSKPDLLNKLAATSSLQHNTLDGAYKANSTDPRNPANASKGVVTFTTSGPLGPQPTVTSKTTVTDPLPKPAGATDTKTTTDPFTNPDIKNTDFSYRMPTAENDAQFQRAQVSLLDEIYSQFMFAQNLKFLKTVFDNELVSIDLDIKRLQIAYLNTLLLSPIDGIVSGLFRDPGDCVKAGQAVLRVENDVEVYLVGTLIFRGLIRVNQSKVTVKTEIFDSATTPFPPLTGTVVSVRGHDSKDDIWDVLIRCGNRVDPSNPNSAPILPLNYNFDYDDTTIDIVT